MFPTSWFRLRTPITGRYNKHHRLGLEQLENRVCLSAGAAVQVVGAAIDVPVGAAVYGPSKTTSPAPTFLTMDGGPSQVRLGQEVDLTAYVAVVASNRRVNSGEVGFFDAGVLLGSAKVGPDGFAWLDTNRLQAGNDTLTAVYQGDADFAGSTSPVWSEIVTKGIATKGITRTTVTASADPTVIGQAVTFTAQVLPARTGNATSPGGTVEFVVDNSVAYSCAINAAGIATFTTTNLPHGSHSLVVIYAGDGNFYGSASGILAEHVIRATPGTVQGLGSIDQGSKSFSFNVDAVYGSNGLLGFGGNLTFTDTQKGFTLSSTAIGGMVIGPDAETAWFTGTATLNGLAGYHFWAKVTASGFFEIIIKGPNGSRYEAASSIDTGSTITISPAP